MAMSREKSPNSQLIGLNAKSFSSAAMKPGYPAVL
jgi:hypothetical protein